jgi:hypothetical protein
MPQLKKVKAGKRNYKPTPQRDQTQESVAQFAGDAYSLAKRSIAGLNELRKLINIEEKYLDTAGVLTPDQAGTSSVVSLTQMAQGVTLNTRVGNSIRVQRFSILGRAAINSATTSFSMVRIILFRDMEGQGSAPTMQDVLEAVGTNAAPRQPYDYLNRKRFSILGDWYYALTLNAGGQGSVREFQLDVPLVKHTLYRGTTAAAASDGEGTIYIGCVSDEATNTPSVSFTSRITFTDD